jgi:O-antigen/teichoic acid export membrane protein
VLDRPSKASLLHSTLSGLAFQYLATAVQGLVQLVVLVVLARLLSPRDFGLAGLAASVIGLAGLAAQFGLGVALIQRPELTERDIRAGFTLSLASGLAMFALIATAAPLVAVIFRNPPLTNLVRALGFTFLLGNPSFVAEALLERRLAWGPLTRANLWAYVLGYGATGLVLALAGAGAWALVGSWLAQTLLKTVLLLWAQPHPKRPLLRGPELPALMRFGRHVALARLFNYGAQQGDNLVVGRMLGAEMLGFYSRAFKLMLLPVGYFALIVTKVAFPAMARFQHDLARVKAAYLTGTAVLCLVSLPLSAIMVVAAPELVRVVLGPKWSPTIIPLQVLALGIAFRNAYLMAYCVDGALGAIQKRSARDGIYAASVVAGSLAGVRFGLAGVAAGVVVAVVVTYLIAAAMSLRLVHGSWREYLASQTPGLLLGVVAAVAGAATRRLLGAIGAPPVLVLVATIAVAGAASGGLLLARPSLAGEYGRSAARLVGDALATRLAPRGLGWVKALSESLARRLAHPAGSDHTAPKAA